MKRGGVNFPDALISAIRRGQFVVFAGAGISMGEPANLPDFPRLVKLVAEGTTLLQKTNELEDRYLGRLHHNKVDVHERSARVLSREGLTHTPLHRDLLRLFAEFQQVQIVTTNFDLLFEQAAGSLFGKSPTVFNAPALPRGRDFKGLIHVHGSVISPKDMVLTDADFGRAYLSEGWARRFLLDVFRNHTVLFVGYSHYDVVMHYLARAIPEHESGRRFALTPANDDPDRWQVLGIEAIPYPMPSDNDHSALSECLALLADSVTRTILDWKKNLADLAEKPPPIDSAEASDIMYALEDVPTTRFFTEYARDPEWLPWLDDHKILDRLFTVEPLDDRDQVFIWWIAEHYATRCPDTVFLLLAKHGMRIHPQFWWALGREIGIGEISDLEEPTISRWVSILLRTAPPECSHDDVLPWLAERCGEMGMISSLLQVFDEMSKSKLKIKPAIIWPGEADE